MSIKHDVCFAAGLAFWCNNDHSTFCVREFQVKTLCSHLGPLGNPTKHVHQSWTNTVEGRNPANQLRLAVYPIVYKGFFAFQAVQEFLPSTA